MSKKINNSPCIDAITGEKIHKLDAGVVKLSTKIDYGNYVFCHIDSCKNVYINKDVTEQITHLTGRSVAVNNWQLIIYGTAKDREALCNIVAYAKKHNWHVSTRRNQYNTSLSYRIVGGRANKLHSITSLKKFIREYSSDVKVNAVEYNFKTNEVIGKYNFDNVDVVKTIQKRDRGYINKLITDRPDFI